MSCKTNKHTQGKLFISTDNFVLCVCCNRRCENQLPLTEVVLLCHLMAELKTERSAGFGYVADFFGFFFFPMTFVTFYRNKQMKTSPPIKNKKEKKNALHWLQPGNHRWHFHIYFSTDLAQNEEFSGCALFMTLSSLPNGPLNPSQSWRLSACSVVLPTLIVFYTESKK